MNIEITSAWRREPLVEHGETTTDRAPAILDELLGAPVLTVSNRDFIRLGSIVALFVEEGIRFAISPDAAQRAGVRLRSRLLQRAGIFKDDRHDRP